MIGIGRGRVVDIVVGYIIASMSAIKIFSESEHEEVALLEWKACSICRVCGESLSEGAINGVNYVMCRGTSFLLGRKRY